MMPGLNLSERGREFIVSFSAMLIIGISGIVLAIAYYIMATLENAFISVNCALPTNVYWATCQDWFDSVLYPVLTLKFIFIFANYFLIFGIVFGFFFMAFRTKKHPALFIVHIIMTIIIGYLSIEIANIYRRFLEIPIMYDMLIPFAIYNKIMLYFPQFIFITVFISGIIGFMGVFKSAGQFNEGNEDLG